MTWCIARTVDLGKEKVQLQFLAEDYGITAIHHHMLLKARTRQGYNMNLLMQVLMPYIVWTYCSIGISALCMQQGVHPNPAPCRPPHHLHPHNWCDFDLCSRKAIGKVFQTPRHGRQERRPSRPLTLSAIIGRGSRFSPQLKVGMQQWPLPKKDAVA
eukprot:1155693-Pelagomonas_calceolata.AAC.5